MIITVDRENYNVNKKTAKLIEELLVDREVLSIFFREEKEKTGDERMMKLWEENRENAKQDRLRISKELENDNENGINEINKQY